MGIKYVPEMMFHISDRQQVIPAEAICMYLSDSRYLGHSPTVAKATTDKNGRNWKLIGLISTQDGKIKNDTNNIQIVNHDPFFIR